MRLCSPGLLLFFFACAAAPAAQEAPGGETIEAFFARFQEAVRGGDPEAVAALARFPLAGIEADREAFSADYYASSFGEGPFRDALLAASPDALEAMDDGSYRYMALVGYTEEGEVVAGDAPEAAYESAMILVFRPDGEGGWYLGEVHFAG
jgi:hypothetical protein